MTAERRYSARLPIDLEVQIRYRGRRFLLARGRNLSLQGIAVAVQNLTLPIGTVVELELDSPGREWLVEAVVAHRDRQGVGLTFREPQPELYQQLSRHFYQRQTLGSSGMHPPPTSRPTAARLRRG